ncbi:MAG: hypothetical protein GEU87_16355 [Alphaproteobacteria bacterium]|nr:hypothetical protein [Alphaproteobacteria bacterium]
MQFSHTEECRSLSGLTPSGRMLLEAMRHAPSGAAATLACFVEVCGDKEARPCFIVFLQIVHSLALYGRRRMRVGTAAWPILTPDEVALLKCVDAAINADDAGLQVHVEWVVRRHGAREFAAYLRTLATLLPEPMFGGVRAPAILAVEDDMALANGRAAERAAREWPASAFPAAIK